MSEPTDDLTGRLLVAHPDLLDPNFRRTVVFLAQHDAEEGTFGLVLNRPLDQFAGEFLPDHEPASVLAQVPVYQGGPVADDRLVFTNFAYDPGSKIARVQHALGLDQVGELVEEGDAAGLRAFLGYAGWSEGQLEKEIRQGAWILADPVAGSFALSDAPRLWNATLARLGGRYAIMAVKPDDPSVN